MNAWLSAKETVQNVSYVLGPLKSRIRKLILTIRKTTEISGTHEERGLAFKLTRIFFS